MRWLAVLLCALCITAQAQVPTLLMPNPLGIAITIGQWIWQSGEKVYYIEVVGYGNTLEQARQNGFRLAVEEAIGSLVSSEAEVQNGQLVRDEIINYSAGYVSKFELVKTEIGPQVSKIAMKVWIKRSALADRLLNESKNSGEVEGATAAVSFQTILQERQTGDRLLQSVLNDYPRRAFDIRIGNTQVNFTNQRSAQLQIPVMINFSRHYLNSFWAALEAIQNSKGCMSDITVKGYGTVNFSDDIKYRMIRDTMVGHSSIRVNLIGTQNQVISTSFYALPNFVTIGDRTQKWFTLCNPPFQLVIDPVKSGPITITMDVDPVLLSQITRVNVEIVKQ